METVIPLNIAVEDPLSEHVLRAILDQLPHDFAIGTCYMRRGFGYLKKTIAGFNNASKATPFFVLTDLNAYECPPRLLREWLPVPAHPNLIFRVAVHEIEAWILAHREAFARFAGIPVDWIPHDLDSIPNTKEFLIRLVEKSRKGNLRNDIVPRKDSTATQGPNYNGRLIEFVRIFWKMQSAQQHSGSLRRTIDRLKSFCITWPRRPRLI